jgi:hypothetical protein
VLKQRFGIVVYQAVTMNNELNTRTQCGLGFLYTKEIRVMHVVCDMCGMSAGRECRE